MPAQTCLIVVEGPHDTEFVARLLRSRGFHRISSWAALSAYWRAVVPQRFPVGNDLLARHPVPTFFRNAGGQTIAIRTANGISRITDSLSDTLVQLASLPEAVAIVLDADQELAPAARHAELLAEWRGKPSSQYVAFPNAAGQVNAGPPKSGVFILPDNIASGTLEDLLIQCASVNYPDSLAAAQAYVAAFPKPDVQANELADFNAPAGRNKATVAAVGSILRPGKAVQVSIQDNRWLAGAALQLPDIVRVSQFLTDLLS